MSCIKTDEPLCLHNLVLKLCNDNVLCKYVSHNLEVFTQKS